MPSGVPLKKGTKMSAEEVLAIKRMIAEGKSMNEIGKILDRAPATVKVYHTRMLENKPLPPTFKEMQDAEIAAAAEHSAKIRPAGEAILKLPAQIFESGQRIELIDAYLTKAQIMLPHCTDEVGFRILSEALATLLTARRTETLAQNGGPTQERPFELTIKVNRGDSVTVSDAMHSEEADDLPELVEGQLIDHTARAPDPGEPQGPAPSPSELADFE